MNRSVLAIIGIPLIMGMSACTDDVDSSSEDGNWIRRSSFEGVVRSGSAVFVWNDKAYIGSGYDGDDYLNDFWSYDAEDNFWQRVADFPGIGRVSSVSFAIDGKGYMGTGYDGTDELQDFWEYDIATDTWTQLSDFASSARLGAIGFALDGRGYVGSGFDGNYLKDFWAYDPAADSWEQIVSLQGEKRENGVALTIDGRVFLGTGRNNGLFELDFWEFESPNTWIELTDLDEDDDYTIARHDAVAFENNGKGYITLGNSGSNLVSTWEYDPLTDEWTEKTDFEGVARQGAVAFTINNRSFIALGRSSSIRFDDVWEFRPDEEADDDD